MIIYDDNSVVCPNCNWNVSSHDVSVSDKEQRTSCDECWTTFVFKMFDKKVMSRIPRYVRCATLTNDNTFLQRLCKHHKGKLYEYIGIVVDCTNNQPLKEKVTYKMYKPEKIEDKYRIFARDIDEFYELVMTSNGQLVQRFEPLTEKQAIVELAAYHSQLFQFKMQT